MLPRIIGQGRASELLYTGRILRGEEAERWGFLNRLIEPEALLQEAQAMAREISEGPTFAHAMTKRMMQMEWAMSVDDAIEAEAVAQSQERGAAAHARRGKADGEGQGRRCQRARKRA